MNRGRKKGYSHKRQSPEDRPQTNGHGSQPQPNGGVEIEVKNKSLVANNGLPTKLKEGTLGKKIKLISNCFILRIPDGFLYHYDVKVKKKRISKTSDPESESSSESEDSDKEENNETEGTDIEVSEAANPPKKKKGGKPEKKKYRCMNTKLNRQVIEAMTKAYDIFKGMYPVYDGKRNLYTRHPLKIVEKLKCEVVLGQQDSFNSRRPNENKMTHFQVRIKPIKKKDGTYGCEINLEPLHALFERRTTSGSEEAMMALETVLRNSACLRFVPIGRSLFVRPRPDEIHPLGGGREIWFGYHQSIRLGQWKPMVNLDVTATPFYQHRPMLEYVAEVIGMDIDGLHRIGAVQEHHLNRMNRELKNLKIEVTHLRGYRRKYRILEDLTDEGANRVTFAMDENGRKIELTVSQYFAQRYGPLRFPHLPCVQITTKTKEGKNSTIYLPVEVCEIIEQHCNKELTPKEVTEMIKFTPKTPAKRFVEIEGVFKMANFKNDVYLKEFELEVLPQPMAVEARVLDAPSLRYDQEDKVRPNDGVWNMIGKKYFRKASVESWVLLSFAQINQEVLKFFAKCLKSMANTQGIDMKEHKYIHQEHAQCSKQKAQNIIVKLKNEYSTDLIVIVLPTEKSRNKSIYNAIKRVAETTGVGLITQCITAGNVIKSTKPKNPKQEFDASLISNLCLKINTKMGGVNHMLTPGETPLLLQEEPVIVMGADINHPGPTDPQNPKPSLAAVVACLNSNASRYAVTFRRQINKKKNKQVEEIIRGLKDMVKELLIEFYKHTPKLKPQKIIFYRDGVSEGQFKDVQKYEIESIRDACRSLQGTNGTPYEPGITYIILQKRHHVKFRPQDERNGVGPMKNVPPGSVVDTTVTHPLNADFYLCSHFGLKGTSRPGYYTVAADDNDLTADQLQKLTYFLCYAYSRCTRSISLPAPVQYAHLAAYRARLHLLSQEEDGNYRSCHQGALEIHKTLKDKMYFV